MHRLGCRPFGVRRRARSVARGIAQGAIAVLVAGCGAGFGDVARVVDGRVVPGGFVEPDAYAAYLRGVIASESGDLAAAVTAFEEASAHEPADPEIWSRIATVRCKRDPRDPAARAAIDRALGLDETYAGAWAADAACAEARGEAARASASARRAAASDPGVADLERLVARADERVDAARGRERLVALTLVRAQSPAAWRALAAWGEAHGDAALVSRALAEVVRQRTDDRGYVATVAVALAGAGELASARALAGALVDASRDGAWARAAVESRNARALIALLAVDDAVVARDVGRVRSRATAMQVPRAQAAARALLLGDAAMASALAGPVLEADPRSLAARWVLAAAAADRGASAAPIHALVHALDGDTRDPSVSFDVFVAYALAVVRAVGARDAAAVLAGVSRDAPVRGDALVTPAAVDLVARGALIDSELTADGRIELALRRGDSAELAKLAAADSDGGNATGGASTPPSPADARHRLAAAATALPSAPSTRALAARLAPAASRDTLVAVALARIAATEGTPPMPAVIGRLTHATPLEPLAAMATLALADRRGDAASAAHARACLARFAATDLERRAAHAEDAAPVRAFSRDEQGGGSGAGARDAGAAGAGVGHTPPVSK